MLIGPGLPVYVAAEAVDMRKSIDGLARLIEESLPTSPFAGGVFVFFNRGRDKVKLLWWDRHGFWLAYKRLERGRFRRPAGGALTLPELTLVLEGIDLAARRLQPVVCQRVG